MDRTSAPLQTVIRAFEIIELLWEGNITGPSDLARQMDMPRSTAHDYLRTLESTGYVVRRDGQYHVGYRFLAMGSRLKHRNRLFHIAKPVLEQIASETGELATVSVEERGRWVVLHDESGPRSLNLGTYPGRRTPLHSHAAGKVILAHLPDEDVEEILDTHGLDPVTENTVTNVETLREELRTIRDDGYALDCNQQIPGMCVVAVPLLNDATVLGALSIATTTDRLKDSAFRSELIEHVRRGAKTITNEY
ncbi:IclR family transcriptional regulator [Haladaptatus sp. CMAA 1911]|uniref:IclR family transcriptional regulator n=1 Tax=Haladaptatus sp. CMAA 1911 TaxID=3368987 RepID=UPI003754C915